MAVALASESTYGFWGALRYYRLANDKPRIGVHFAMNEACLPPQLCFIALRDGYLRHDLNVGLDESRSLEERATSALTDTKALGHGGAAHISLHLSTQRSQLWPTLSYGHAVTKGTTAPWPSTLSFCLAKFASGKSRRNFLRTADAGHSPTAGRISRRKPTTVP